MGLTPRGRQSHSQAVSENHGRIEILKKRGGGGGGGGNRYPRREQEIQRERVEIRGALENRGPKRETSEDREGWGVGGGEIRREKIEIRGERIEIREKRTEIQEEDRDPKGERDPKRG